MNFLKSFMGVLFLVLSFGHVEGQRFSLIAEAGYVRSQIDGDKIQGFYYNGFVTGIGSNYAFDPDNFLSIKTSFYVQGSRRNNISNPISREGFQLEVDLNTVGLELSYKYDPTFRRYFIGAGIVRHQIVSLDYRKVLVLGDNSEEFILPSEQLASGYTSFKFYYGYDLFKRAGLYFAVETGITDILKSNFDQVRSLTPYSLSAVFTYEIIASKVEPRKQRPGSKSRSKTNKIVKKRKGRRFAY